MKSSEFMGSSSPALFLNRFPEREKDPGIGAGSPGISRANLSCAPFGGMHLVLQNSTQNYLS